jgi:hypothetical protein
MTSYAALLVRFVWFEPSGSIEYGLAPGSYEELGRTGLGLSGNRLAWVTRRG